MLIALRMYKQKRINFTNSKKKMFAVGSLFMMLSHHLSFFCALPVNLKLPLRFVPLPIPPPGVKEREEHLNGLRVRCIV